MESGLSGCSDRGECSELTGQPLCHCDEGYSGVKCERCDIEVGIFFYIEKICDVFCCCWSTLLWLMWLNAWWFLFCLEIVWTKHNRRFFKSSMWRYLYCVEYCDGLWLWILNTVRSKWELDSTLEYVFIVMAAVGLLLSSALIICILYLKFTGNKYIKKRLVTNFFFFSLLLWLMCVCVFQSTKLFGIDFVWIDIV